MPSTRGGVTSASAAPRDPATRTGARLQNCTLSAYYCAVDILPQQISTLQILWEVGIQPPYLSGTYSVDIAAVDTNPAEI